MAKVTSISSDITKTSRSCNGCTKCCEGYLKTEIDGQSVHPGRPCKHHIKGGCAIYDKRPFDPCISYQCAWLSDPDLIPEHFWPAHVNVIFSKRFTSKGIPYLEIKEAGDRLPVEVLDWAVQQVQLGIIKNIYYEIAGQWRGITSQKEFAKERLEVNT